MAKSATPKRSPNQEPSRPEQGSAVTTWHWPKGLALITSANWGGAVVPTDPRVHCDNASAKTRELARERFLSTVDLERELLLDPLRQPLH